MLANLMLKNLVHTASSRPLLWLNRGYCKDNELSPEKEKIYRKAVNGHVTNAGAGLNKGFTLLRIDRYGNAEEALDAFYEARELLKNESGENLKETDKLNSDIECGIKLATSPPKNLTDVCYHVYREKIKV